MLFMGKCNDKTPLKHTERQSWSGASTPQAAELQSEPSFPGKNTTKASVLLDCRVCVKNHAAASERHKRCRERSRSRRLPCLVPAETCSDGRGVGVLLSPPLRSLPMLDPPAPMPFACKGKDAVRRQLRVQTHAARPNVRMSEVLFETLGSECRCFDQKRPCPRCSSHIENNMGGISCVS